VMGINFFTTRRYNSKDELLHYRIVYNLMRDIVLQQDEIDTLKGGKKMGEFVYCPICGKPVEECEHSRLSMLCSLLDALDKRGCKCSSTQDKQAQ